MTTENPCSSKYLRDAIAVPFTNSRAVDASSAKKSLKLSTFNQAIFFSKFR